MSDNESFISIENNNDEVKNNENKTNLNLDNFLDYNIDYMNDVEKYNYIGVDILQRPDYFEIKKDKIEFFVNDQMSDINNALHSRKKEEIDIFLKIKKELYNIAYKNHHNQLNINNNDNNNLVDEKNKMINENSKIINESVKLEKSNNKNEDKNKKSYDILNNDLSMTLGNKIEDTYNEIKSSVNWLGNFFSNNENYEKKKNLNIFYKDLYFFNDTTIIRFLDTYNYNMLKTLNKIIKCILWRQMSIIHYNNKQDTLNNSNNTTNNNNIFVNPKNLRNSLMKMNIFRCGYDLKSRPLLYIKIQEKLDIKEEELILMLVYHVDMCMNSVDYKKCYQKNNNLDNSEKIKFDESSLQLVIVVDCLKFDLNNMISVDCIKKIINIFNEFYTDVLYRIYIINVPSFFKKVWSLFNMFIDNHTLKKIIIINKKNINLMYEHIISNFMMHFDRTSEKKDESSIFFPSNTLYYKYDEKYYEKLVGYVNIWVDKMIKVNH
ncbi:conserved Plasmodium protein, unknown function [Plasmodium gallinaceum]|uniref:CRAL-TRIO domain-containing protein n=1 Tax=Plasmodium gallinaceum TaxID=5849 RepID=A0A1J1GW25_PLAGA|nr:conserved Plasmodium protein, unknown function [Plasmodium gallinaceum]CRG96754.1 conserved Plasmodium protein, unknown function [Plasmodium gallinaceum]